MTDQLTQFTSPSTDVRAEAVTLRAGGKHWGILHDGRYLEVVRRGQIVTFDLWESVRLGHGVIVAWMEDGE